jgi:hypothetical protein
MSEETMNRLEGIRAARPGMFRAAAKAVLENRIDPTRFGLSREQVLNAADAGRHHLESVGIPQISLNGLEAIVRIIGRPPLLIRGSEVEMQPVEDFPPGPMRKSGPLRPSSRRLGESNSSITACIGVAPAG